MSREPQFLKLTASAATDIGGQREHNEDTVLIRADLRLYVVADGAGGHNAGNVASALATSALANAFESGASRFVSGGEGDALGPALARRLAAAVHHANREIVDIAKSSNKYRGMGSTVVAGCFSPSTCELFVAHVGDSRCYRLRAGDLEQLTHDHSLFNDVLEMRPDIDDAALSRLPRHVITRALGMESSIRVSIRSHFVIPGDRFLLCSDGVTDVLDDDAIAQVLRMQLTPEEIVREVIEASLHAGAEDNIAAVVLFAEKGDDDAVQPSRRSARPPRVVLPAAEARELQGSAPEIIIMNVEEVDEDDASITVVQSQTAPTPHADSFAGLRMKKQRNNPGD